MSALPITINLIQHQFESIEAADNAKIFTEGNILHMRNYMTQIMEDLANLSVADHGLVKFAELRGRYQGEIAACNYFLNTHYDALQAKNTK